MTLAAHVVTIGVRMARAHVHRAPFFQPRLPDLTCQSRCGFRGVLQATTKMAGKCWTQDPMERISNGAY